MAKGRENMINTKINPDFSKEWLVELKKQYFLFFKEYLAGGDEVATSTNRRFWKELGAYWQRYLVKNDAWALANKKAGMIERGEYYESLLWPTYINILEHVQLNLDFYKNLKFIDNGSGTGLFSVFLKELGIDCYNQDNFAQTGGAPLSFSERKGGPMGHIIHPVKSAVPKDASVILSSGCWVDNAAYLQLDEVHAMMLDNRWIAANAHGKGNASIVPQLVERYNLVFAHQESGCNFYVKKDAQNSLVYTP